MNKNISQLEGLGGNDIGIVHGYLQAVRVTAHQAAPTQRASALQYPRIMQLGDPERNTQFYIQIGAHSLS